MGFDEVGIGPYGGELQYLVEALIQPQCFDVVKDEGHAARPVRCFAVGTAAPSG